MQHLLINEDKTTSQIYAEYRHESGFTIREMLLRTRNTRLRFQAGFMITRAMQNPIYSGGKGEGVTSYIEHGSVQVFHLHGYGPTLEDAVMSASNKLLRAEISNRKGESA